MTRQESFGMQLCQIRTFFEKICLPYQHFAVCQTVQLDAIALSASQTSAYRRANGIRPYRSNLPSTDAEILQTSHKTS